VGDGHRIGMYGGDPSKPDSICKLGPLVNDEGSKNPRDILAGDSEGELSVLKVEMALGDELAEPDHDWGSIDSRYGEESCV
jgi:hypothetical protein